MSSPDLLGLSGELRNKIWRYVLVDDQPIDVTCKIVAGRKPLRSRGSKSNPIDLTNDSPLRARLLAVNRQIRQECASIYYGENVFQFEIDLRLWSDFDSEHFRKLWPAVIEAKDARRIRKFIIKRKENTSIQPPPHGIAQLRLSEYKNMVQFFGRMALDAKRMDALAQVIAYLRSHGIGLRVMEAGPITTPPRSMLAAHEEAFRQKFEELKNSLLEKSIVAKRRSRFCAT